MTVPKAPSSPPPVEDVPDIPAALYGVPFVDTGLSIFGALAEGAEAIETGLADAIRGGPDESEEGKALAAKRRADKEELKRSGYYGSGEERRQGQRDQVNTVARQLGALNSSISEAIEHLQSGPYYLGEHFRLHAEMNDDGNERVFLQLQVADKWESFLSIDDLGNMKLKGTLTQSATFDTEGEEPQ